MVNDIPDGSDQRKNEQSGRHGAQAGRAEADPENASESGSEWIDNSQTGSAELDEHEQSARRLTHLVYALQALAFFAGVTAVIGVFINHLKRDDLESPLAESHFRWQINTFWWGLLWMVIGTVTYLAGIGYIVLSIVPFWYAYRIIKGWLRLNGGKPMYS